MDNNGINLDDETIKKLQSITNNPNIKDTISHISPEMIQNFSQMLNNNSNGQNNNVSNNSNNSFDFNNLDINTINKLTSIMNNMNSKSDPRVNLLNSLKPYLRDSKKDKLDTYMNLLNVSKIAELMNKNNGDNQK